MLDFQLWVSTISDQQVTVAVLLFIMMLLSEKKKLKEFYVVLFTTSLAMVTTFALKHLLHVPRPEHMLVATDNYRFPSGHATMASVVMCLGIHYAHLYVKNVYTRNLLCVLFVSWYVLVSYSRLYLQVHYPIDVIAGGIIGYLATVIVLHAFKHLQYKH
jgi:undecaprenyl-diphosphatase